MFPYCRRAAVGGLRSVRLGRCLRAARCCPADASRIIVLTLPVLAVRATFPFPRSAACLYGSGLFARVPVGAGSWVSAPVSPPVPLLVASWLDLSPFPLGDWVSCYPIRSDVANLALAPAARANRCGWDMLCRFKATVLLSPSGTLIRGGTLMPALVEG